MADLVECGECWKEVPVDETIMVEMGNYGRWRMCRACQEHERALVNEPMSPPWAPSQSGPAMYSVARKGGVREVQNVR